MKRIVQTGLVLAVSPAFVVLAQLPPGAAIVQIELPFPDTGARINNSRQVAFTNFPGRFGVGGVIMHYQNGNTSQISDEAWYSVAPEINELGQIAWQQGEWGGNYDIVLQHNDGFFPDSN